MTSLGLFRESAGALVLAALVLAALVLAALALAVAEFISLSILAAQGGDYDIGEIARSGIFFLQLLLTLLAGILLLGGLVGIYLKACFAEVRLSSLTVSI